MKVGLTGGMGSGKSTAARIFEVMGIPVYYADDRAKQLMVEDPALRAGIISLFGPESYEGEKLNRGHIAALAFADPSLLQKLEAIVHPAVQADGERWRLAQKDVPYTLKEAALLFESGSFREMDKVIVVTAPLELRVERVMRRDHITRDAIESRIARQMLDEEKIKRADFVIFNDGSRSLVKQVWEIHRQLCR